MLRPADDYFLQHDEPVKSCLGAMRTYILNLNADVTEKWQYGMPFYYYKGKRFCYLWTHKKLKQPYLGIVEGKLIDHPDLITEQRERMKILLLDPTKDLPMKQLNEIMKMALRLYE